MVFVVCYQPEWGKGDFFVCFFRYYLGFGYYCWFQCVFSWSRGLFVCGFPLVCFVSISRWFLHGWIISIVVFRWKIFHGVFLVLCVLFLFPVGYVFTFVFLFCDVFFQGLLFLWLVLWPFFCFFLLLFGFPDISCFVFCFWMCCVWIVDVVVWVIFCVVILYFLGCWFFSRFFIIYTEYCFAEHILYHSG